MDEILDICNLKTYLNTDEGSLKAVDGVSIKVNRGEVLGIVGESGCGKTMMSLSIMQMLPKEAKIVDGKIYFKKNNLLEFSSEHMREIRGSGIAMIFQDPLTSLNPVFSIEEQLTCPIMVHNRCSFIEAKKIAIDMLNKVGITAADKRIKEYPHQFSGGQRQRIMIAASLSLKPEILIADEPTTALDVSIQAQILDLLRELQKEFNTALLFISHNLAVISEIAQNVAVMYSGWIVEEAPSEEIFNNPFHPYTKALIEAVPSIYDDSKVLKSLPGSPPALGELITGCKLHPRCPYKIKGKCDKEEPLNYYINSKHRVKCFLAAK